MLDTFKARLKSKLKDLGVNLSTKRMDAIADRLHKKNPDLKDDKDHDEKIDELNELSPFEDIAKSDDRVRTLEAKTKEKPPKKDEDQEEEGEGEDDAGTTKPKPKGKKKTDDEPPAWAKQLLGEVASLKKEKVQSTIQQKIAAKLKDKVPEKFYSKRALPESEEDLDDFISEIETDWSDLKQSENNEGLGKTTKPGGGGEGADNLDVTDKGVKASVDRFFEKSKPKDSNSKK
jgi:hypothetical protein